MSSPRSFRSFPTGRIVHWALVGLIPVAGLASDPQVPPHFDAKARQVEYAGPGREEPEPELPDEVRLAYFGPDDPDHPTGGDAWLASSLAVEEANRAGGYRGVPFRLVPAWSADPWGTGVAGLARAVYDDRVWAVIGSIDGASTHLAEQVVAKARLTLIAPAGTDKTVNYANVAWMFSCLPPDDRWTDVLVDALVREVGRRPFTLITSTDHDARAATVELLGSMSERSMGPRYHVEVEAGTANLDDLAARVIGTDPAAVVILAGPVDTSRVVVALRERRPGLPVYGGPSMGRRVFLDKAGAAADGARFPFLCDPGALVESRAFLEARLGRQVDCATAQAYDATRLLITAIRRAGLNRARIRDAVQDLSPWEGAAGPIEWNTVGQNERAVRVATAEAGRAIPLPPPSPLPSE